MRSRKHIELVKDAAPDRLSPKLDGMLERLRTIGGSLPPTSRRIAEFLINNASDVVHMSVTEVAEQTQASEGSVVGLCQQLGARGFQQLKIALAQELVRPVQFIHEDLNRTDTPTVIVSKIFSSGMQALHDTMQVIGINALKRAAQALHDARRVEVYGIGSSAPIAEDAGYRLLRIGVDARVAVDSHVQAVSASLTGPGVAVLTISHSGATHETLTAMRLAREAGARTICITNFGRSPILAYADIVLHTMARETHFRTEAMTSRIAQLAIIDALIACIALADYDRSVDTLRKTSDVLSTKRF